VPSGVEGGHAGAEERYKALLEVTGAIIRNEDVGSLSREVARCIARIVGCDLVVFFLHDPKSGALRLTQVGTPTSENFSFPHAFNVEESPSGEVWRSQKPLVYQDVTSESAFPKIFDVLRAKGLKTYYVLPVSTAKRRIGTLAFAKGRACAFSPSDMEFFRSVAEQLAVMVASGIDRERAESYRQQLSDERDRLQLLLELSNVLASSLEIGDLLPAASSCLARVIAHDYFGLCLLDDSTGLIRGHALHLRARVRTQQELVFSPEHAPQGWVISHRRPLILDPLSESKYRVEAIRRLVAAGVQSACWLPLIIPKRTLGTLCIGSLARNALKPEDMEFLTKVANQVAMALENAFSYREIQQLKDKLAAEKSYLEKEIEAEYSAEEIVGESPALLHPLEQAQTVAGTKTTVLILGETGTGKELIARRIHYLSSRREQSFIKLNCAPIPAGLLESELFGHEKGAFTGAVSSKIGHLELAHKGTLFLDEIGDIPLEIQPKLLRLLQEHEFERLGSNRTQKVDVRVIAATNRDLKTMVAQGEFRRDLYYRISVFPIVGPALRERREDIPMLVRYFVQKFSRLMNRNIQVIPDETMNALCQWHWPGNVRELENLMERAVILSPSLTLNVPLAELEWKDESRSPLLLEDAEREHILRVLRETKGVVGGLDGAAARLGLRRTTLHFKMKKLGITRDDL